MNGVQKFDTDNEIHALERSDLLMIDPIIQSRRDDTIVGSIPITNSTDDKLTHYYSRHFDKRIIILNPIFHHQYKFDSLIDENVESVNQNDFLEQEKSEMLMFFRNPTYANRKPKPIKGRQVVSSVFVASLKGKEINGDFRNMAFAPYFSELGYPHSHLSFFWNIVNGQLMIHIAARQVYPSLSDAIRCGDSYCVSPEKVQMRNLTLSHFYPEILKSYTADLNPEYHDDFNAFFTLHRERQITPSRENYLGLRGMKVNLMPFQRDAVHFMIGRETNPQINHLNDTWNILRKHKLKENLFYFPVLGIFTRSDLTDAVYKTKKGGILADEMGLGKTIELLALVASLPPPTFDENSSINKPSTSAKSNNIHFEEKDDFVLKFPRLDHSIVTNVIEEIVNAKDESAKKICTICARSFIASKMHWHQEFDKQGIPFICPECNHKKALHGDRDSIGATLIIVPQALIKQWTTEIEKHTNHGFIVQTYKDVADGEGYMHPVFLNNCHVVLCTYETLRKELNHTDISSNDRNFRKRDRDLVRRLPTPLIAVNWWRICCDESQLVDTSSSISQMFRMLCGRAKWCVTGTPLMKSVHDLSGLIEILDLYPYCLPSVWQATFWAPWTRNDTNPMLQLMSQIMWRNSKKDVQNQINFRTVDEVITLLKFSPLEERLYVQQVQDTKNRLGEILESDELADCNIDVPLSDLPQKLVVRVIRAMNRLRLYILTGGSHVLRNGAKKKKRKAADGKNKREMKSKPVLSIEEAGRIKLLQRHKKLSRPEDTFKRLFNISKKKLEDSQRSIVASRNAIAGLCFLWGDHANALQWYDKALNIWKETNETNQTLGLSIEEDKEGLQDLEDEELAKLKLTKQLRNREEGQQDIGLLIDADDKVANTGLKLKPLRVDYVQMAHLAKNGNELAVVNTTAAEWAQKENLSSFYFSQTKYFLRKPRHIVAKAIEALNKHKKSFQMLEDGAIVIDILKESIDFILNPILCQIVKDYNMTTHFPRKVNSNEVFELISSKISVLTERIIVVMQKVAEVLHMDEDDDSDYSKALEKLELIDYDTPAMLQIDKCPHGEKIVYLEKDPNTALTKEERLLEPTMVCALCDLRRSIRSCRILLEDTFYTTEDNDEEEEEEEAADVIPKKRAKKMNNDTLREKRPLIELLRVLISHIQQEREDYEEFQAINYEENEATYRTDIIEGFMKNIETTMRLASVLFKTLFDLDHRRRECASACIRFKEGMIISVNELIVIEPPKDPTELEKKDRYHTLSATNKHEALLERFISQETTDINLRKNAMSEIRYMSTLNGGYSIRECPICLSDINIEWTVYPCAHVLCNKCFDRIRGTERGPEGTTRCVTCRRLTKNSLVSTVSCEVEDEIIADVKLTVKYNAIIRCLRKILHDNPKDKVLIFSSIADSLHPFKLLLDLDNIKCAWKRSMSKKDSGEIEKFKTDPQIRVILLDILTCSNGLNLAEANHVIFMEPIPECSVIAQAIGRIDRFNQQKNMKVYNFVVEQSVEEEIYKFASRVNQETQWTLRTIADLFGIHLKRRSNQETSET